MWEESLIWFRKKQNLEINEANERKIREELRASGDIAIYAKKIEPEIKKAFEKGNVVLESLYAWSEYKYLKEIYGENLKVLAIVTDKKLRQKRLLTRPIRPLTKEEFLSRDYSQIEKLEQGGPISHADHFITNNSTLKVFTNKVKKYIKSLE